MTIAARSPFRRRPAALRIHAAEAEAEVQVYDEIGYWGIQAKDFIRELKGLDVDTIHLRVNSPGGDVFDGVAIYNALREHRARVITHVDGLAASIASIIALAGDEVRMAENAFFMIHHPWGITIGNANDHRKTAATLDKIGDSLIQTYVRNSESDEDRVRTWMDEETWFSAVEAKDAGFVDVVEEEVEAEARLDRFDLSAYRRAPAALVERIAASARPSHPKRDLERVLRDAGYSRSEAKAIVASANALSLRDADEDGLIAAARQLAATITA